MHEILGRLVNSPYMLRWPISKQEEAKVEMVKEVLNYHYQHNGYYRSVCESAGFLPSDIKGIDDFMKVPIIPLSFFKQPDSEFLLSVPLEDIEFTLTSTGTSGVKSYARRDPYTTSNALVTLLSLYRDYFRISGGAAMFFCASPEEMPELGMVKALNVMSGLLNAVRFAVNDVNFDPDRTIKIMEEWEGRFTRYMFGAPFLINRFLDYLKENDIRLKLDPKTIIATIGGWKRYTGSQIPRSELTQKCVEYLGIKPEQFRDIYGFAEASMLMIECEEHVMHVPPYVHVSIRDENNPSVEVEPGKSGLIVVFDTATLSYPCFIMTEDVGILTKDVDCPCGRKGDRLQVIGRSKLSNLHSCAVRLDRYLEQTSQLDFDESIYSLG